MHILNFLSFTTCNNIDILQDNFYCDNENVHTFGYSLFQSSQSTYQSIWQFSNIAMTQEGKSWQFPYDYDIKALAISTHDNLISNVLATLTYDYVDINSHPL